MWLRDCKNSTMAIVQIALLLVMAAEDQSKELSYIVNKGAVNIVQDYFRLLESVEPLMAMSKLNVQQISEAAGISEWQLYRRKNKPELWTKEELIKLLKHLDVPRIEQEFAKDANLGRQVGEVSSPFLGPRAESKEVAEFRAKKQALYSQGYPINETKSIVSTYYESIKANVIQDIDKDTLLIKVPSGTGVNPMPILLANKIANDTGATILKEGYIGKLHKAESKMSLSLDQRIHDPIRYKVVAADALRSITAKFKKVVIVDDLIDSGESCVRLKKTLEANSVGVYGFVSLVNVENRYPSPADIERVHNKISDFANLSMTDKLKLKSDLNSVFQDYTKQKLNDVEKNIRNGKSALSAFKVISKAAAYEAKLDKPESQSLSL
jgi:hypothetical protein